MKAEFCLSLIETIFRFLKCPDDRSFSVQYLCLQTVMRSGGSSQKDELIPKQDL